MTENGIWTSIAIAVAGVAERDRVAREPRQPGHSLDEGVEEDVAPHLAVGDHIHPGSLLDAQRLVDRGVLDRPIRLGGHPPGTHRLARLDQRRGPEQRADHLGVIDRCRHHRTVADLGLPTAAHPHVARSDRLTSSESDGHVEIASPASGLVTAPPGCAIRRWFGVRFVRRGGWNARVHLERVTLIVDDYDKAIAFFVDALGFELADDSPSLTNDGRPKRWVVVRPPGGHTGLLLARADGPEQEDHVGAQFAGRVGLFLRVDDFDAQHERMTGAGVRFVTEPRDEPYGRVAVWEDVAGNRWDLVGPAPGPTGT